MTEADGKALSRVQPIVCPHTSDTGSFLSPKVGMEGLPIQRSHPWEKVLCWAGLPVQSFVGLGAQGGLSRQRGLRAPHAAPTLQDRAGLLAPGSSVPVASRVGLSGLQFGSSHSKWQAGGPLKANHPSVALSL